MTRTAPRLITAAQLAQQLSLHIKTVRTNTRRGLYDAFAVNLGTPGRPRWRYDAARLQQWIDGHRAA